MNIKHWFCSKILILLVIFTFFQTNLSADVLNYVQISGPGKFFCERSISADLICDTSNTDIVRASGSVGDFTTSSFDFAKNRNQKQIKKTKKKIKKAAAGKRKRKLKSKIKKLKKQKREILACENKTDRFSFATECNDVDLCDLFAPPTTEGLTSRLLNGHICNNQSDSSVIRLEDNGEEGLRLCAATVIASNAVLISAFCLPPLLSVENGGNKTFFIKLVQGDKEYEVGDVITHPDYDPSDDTFGGARNELSIVVTKEEIDATPLPIINSNEELNPFETVLFAGYGAESISVADNLSVGQGVFTGMANIGNIFDFIATQDSSDARTCNGDIGNPLLVYRDSKWVVAGVETGFILEEPNDGIPCNQKDHFFINLLDSTNSDFIAETLAGL